MGSQQTTDLWTEANGLFEPQTTQLHRPHAKIIDRVVIEVAALAASIGKFCNDHGVSQQRLYQLGWGLTLNCYNGADQIVSGFSRSVGDVKQQEISSFFVNVERSCEVLECLNTICEDASQHGSSPTAQFNTNLSICDIDPRSAVRWTPEHYYGPVKLKGGILMDLIVAQSAQSISLVYQAPTLDSVQALGILQTFAFILMEITKVRSRDLIRDLNIVSTEDMTTLSSWNTHDFVLHDECIFHYIEHFAKTSPEKEAVVSLGDRNFTYQELDDVTSRVAKYLHDQGVRRGTIVPFLFEKSPWSVVCMIATNKAGGAYVGLNSEMPPDRLQFIFEFTKAPFILTSSSMQLRLQDQGITCLVIDENLITAIPSLPHGFKSLAKPDDIAYIVFTSGSTGLPKGIMIEHRTYVASAFGQHKAASINDTTRMIHFSAHNFDAVNLEVFTTLIAGGTLCVPTEHSRLNDLAGTIQTLNVNYIGTTPALAKIVSPEDVPALRTFAVWGEAASQDVTERWSAAMEVVNYYGPAEASCVFSMNSYSRESRRVRNIGKAMNGAVGWVVKPENPHRLVPIGGIGELLIGGSIVGRGYLHDQKKTAAAYLDDMEWMPKRVSANFTRVYRTGDLVRQNRDGSFEYCGRIDKQVKIRGQRVELGEIEHAINLASSNSSSTTIEVCQLPWRKDSDSKVLIAFQATRSARHDGSPKSLLLSSTKGHQAEIEKLTATISKTLPEYMIPTIFLPLQYTPVTQQGKSDKKLLTKLVEELSSEELAGYSLVKSSKEPPDTSAELLFRQIFSETLDIAPDEIMKYANFFWLGGNSLKAMKLTALARGKGFDLSIPEVLQNPELCQLAALAETRPLKSQVEYRPFDGIDDDLESCETLQKKLSAQIGVAPDDIEDILLATDYQTSSTAWSTLKQRGAINFLVFDFSRSVSASRLEAACLWLSRRHSILRTVFVPHRRRLLQVVVKSPGISVSRHRCMRSMSETTQAIVDEDLSHYVDPTRQQTQFKLLGEGKRVDRLLIRLSHAQYDGQSLSILCTELRAAYAGQNPPKRLTFPEYLHNARSRFEKEGLDYWQHLLKASSVTPIIAHERPVFVNVTDGVMKRCVPTTLLKSHRDISSVSSVKTAWALVLAETSQRQDVVFGSPAWGRNAPVPGADTFVGSTICHIPVRAEVGLHKTYLDLLTSIQQQHVASMVYESIGANTIAEKCTSWPRWQRLSSLVLYQGLQGEAALTKSAPLIEAGVSFSVDEIVSPADRTDILLHVEPQGDETVILMRYSRRLMSESLITELMRRFVGKLELILHHVDATISIEQMDTPLLPLPAPGLEAQFDPVSSKSSLDNGGEPNGVLPPTTLVPPDVGQIVSDAWSQCFSLTQSENEQCHREATPYYDIWGNVIASYALARFYEARDFDVTPEDIMLNPDMQAQGQLLTRTGLM